MKAMTIPRHGGPEVLEWSEAFPEPQLKASEALVRVERTGVNRMDFLVRGGYPGLTVPLPHVCGGDIAGTVEATGSAVTGIQAGSRVVVYPLIACGECKLCRSGKPNLCMSWKSIGIHRRGGYAEFAAVPGGNVVPLPDEVSFDDAVSLPVAGLTAHHAIHTVGKLEAGETLFLWGGAGAIGSMAIQIAKDAGATVISTAGTDERVEAVLSMGADYCFNRRRENVSERVRELAPEGVDAVLDYIGQATFDSSISLLTNGGRALLCGIMTGRTTELNIHQTYFHHRSLHGLFLGTRNDMERIVDLVARRRVRPHIHEVLPLAEAGNAHRTVEAGESIGKIVLEP